MYTAEEIVQAIKKINNKHCPVVLLFNQEDQDIIDEIKKQFDQIIFLPSPFINKGKMVIIPKSVEEDYITLKYERYII